MDCNTALTRKNKSPLYFSISTLVVGDSLLPPLIQSKSCLPKSTLLPFTSYGKASISSAFHVLAQVIVLKGLQTCGATYTSLSS